MIELTGKRLTVRRAATSRLFGAGRRLEIDAATRMIEEIRWRLWRARSRTIPFKAVSHIHTGYEKSFLDAGSALRAAGREEGTQGSESYLLGLVLKKTGEVIEVARFSGDVALSEQSDTHETGYYQVLRVLKELTGLSVGQPLPVAADADGKVMVCSRCGRANGPVRRKCQYCGGPCTSEVAVPASNIVD